MPWCETCHRFLTPSTVQPDGSCPTCGRAIAPSEDESAPMPWHLKLLAGAVVLYLGFRAWQGVEWLLHRF
jgi:uncharacterized paraquat-inducible protein A